MRYLHILSSPFRGIVGVFDLLFDARTPFDRDDRGVVASEYLLLSAFVISASSDKAIFKAT